MSVELRKTSVKLYQRQYDAIERMAKNEGTSISDVMRELIDRALTEKVTEENTDLIAHIVKKQLEVVLKPHVERLAALSSKGGHMAARATFLNVQALMDLVPPENRKDVRAMYESASKKAVAYMHMPVE
ncbi:MAG: ribbon-helix-helix protein, CopG family [Peptostreptococcaceae bacterium]|nr:ribbon-helix-helix protein, CopG family [Peptostreptococcaceae bacterium]